MNTLYITQKPKKRCRENKLFISQKNNKQIPFEGEPDLYIEDEQDLHQNIEDEQDLKLMELQNDTKKNNKIRKNINSNSNIYSEKKRKNKYNHNGHQKGLNEKLIRRMSKSRPSSPFNSSIIEFWKKETLSIFKEHGDKFCVDVDGKWWIFEIDIYCVVSGGIKVHECGACIQYKFAKHKVIKNCVIYVLNVRRDGFHYRIRITPSAKQDKLGIFNVDEAMRLKTEAMEAAMKNKAVGDDIHWTLSLLNEKYGPGEVTGKFIYLLPKCGWYVKRKFK